MATASLTESRHAPSEIKRAIAALEAAREDFDAPVDVVWLSQLNLTLDEFLRLPDVKPALEYQGGRITQKVSPKLRHGRMQLTLCVLFNHYGEPGKIALAFPELRFSLPPSRISYVPDVAVIRWERIPLAPDGEALDDFFAMPDILVEVLSPGQRVNPTARRCAWYVSRGAQAALLVDPRRHTITVFRPGQEAQALSGADRLDLTGVLPGCNVPVDDIFAALRLR